MTKRLDQRVCIVTGASSGVGRATALAFAREGAKVVAAARRGDELQALTAEAGGGEGHVLGYRADVTREDEVRGLIDFTMENFGRLDAAVNAAGAIFGGGLTHQLDEAVFREWIDGYLISAFLSMKHELRAMLESPGTESRSIINVGTFVGYTKTIAGTAPYASAKTGLIGLTRTVATEYADRNIRANLLIVGGVDTPMFHRMNDSGEKHAAATRLHAMKRISGPEEIASAALFLASNESSFVTGTLLTVDGGVSLV